MEKNTKRNLLTVGAIASIVALGGVAATAQAAGNPDIRDQSVQSVDIDADAVGKSEIRTGAVGSLEVLNQSLQSIDLDEGSVGRSEIRNGTITTADIADSTEDALTKRARSGLATEDFAEDRSVEAYNLAKDAARSIANKGDDALSQRLQSTENDLAEVAHKVDSLPDPEKGDKGEDGVSGYEVIGQEKRQEPGDVAFLVSCPSGKQAIGGGTKVDDQNKAVALMDGPNGLTESEDGTWGAKAWQGMFRVTEKTNVTVYAVCANV